MVFSVLALPVAACTAPIEEDEGDTGDVSEALSQGCAIKRSTILASASPARRRAMERGFTWLDANVPYSQSRSYKGYRTDCSGFVSMAWELGTSYTTANFISGGGQSHAIGAYGGLVPGDALVRRANGAGHIVMFLGWNDSAKTSACVIEQASTALDMQFRVRTAASLRSGGYKAIRANKLRSDTGGSSAAPSGPVDDQDDDDDAVASSSSGSGSSSGPSGTGKACGSDGMCNPGNDGSGLICQAGRCVPGCRSNAHCPGITKCVAGQCR
ncbi:MAG: hypothetical protein KF819_31515 [Labilithrix sp.]|nr:hypothetical protein [Labilithrix sp.]